MKLKRISHKYFFDKNLYFLCLKAGVVTSEDDEEFKDQGRTKSKIVNKTFKKFLFFNIFFL